MVNLQCLLTGHAEAYVTTYKDTIQRSGDTYAQEVLNYIEVNYPEEVTSDEKKIACSRCHREIKQRVSDEEIYRYLELWRDTV